jgi:hypothetical protein
MAKAKKRVSTPRKTAPKKQKSAAPKKKKAAPKYSSIIMDCVRYAQSLAAYGAGFEADTTDDNEIASAGGPLGKVALDNAEVALAKLTSATQAGRVILTFNEMHALAAACYILTRVDARGSALTETQRDFVECFARSAVVYFRHAEEVASKAAVNAQGDAAT